MKDKLRSLSPIKPLQKFLKTESSSGIILLAAAALALLIANSSFVDEYVSVFQSYISVGIADFKINKPLILWINDGLMAIFFLLVGLEVKREIQYGELSDTKSALFPVVAALGGAIVPGIIFFAFNNGSAFMDGWAISIATDIAFAIGILMLLGSKVPAWAKVFLTAVAIVDDLVAVLIIAVFYTENIKMAALIIAGLCVVVLLVMNKMNVKKIGLYLMVGAVLWVAFLKSGAHATIAGVLLGLTIPARRTSSLALVTEKVDAAATHLRKALTHKEKESREMALNYLGEVVEEAESPLYRLEHRLHPWVAFGIIPVFAFANAGVVINTSALTAAFSSTLTWGIIAALFFGKQIGIFGSVFIMDKLGFSSLPNKKGTYKIVYGLACLCGVGFTMSLFIASLSFENPQYMEYAKVGIITGSVLSGLLGYIVLRSAINEY